MGGEPEDVFARFDTEPLAAASIAQVHRAQLHDGSEVVVKIRRPGISEVIEADLRLLERLAALAEAELPALQPYRPQQLVREFARSLRRELNLAGARLGTRLHVEDAGVWLFQRYDVLRDAHRPLEHVTMVAPCKGGARVAVICQVLPCTSELSHNRALEAAELGRWGLRQRR